MKKVFMTILCTLCALIANAEPVEFISEQLDSVTTLWGRLPQNKDYVKVADQVKQFANPKQRSATYVIKHKELPPGEKVYLQHEVVSWAIDNYYHLTKDIESHTHGVYFGFSQNVFCGRIGLSKNYYQQYHTTVEIKFHDTEIVVAIHLGDPKMAVGAYASAETYDIQEHYPYISEGKADAMYALAYRNYEYYLMFPAWDLYQHLNTRHFEIND